MPQQQEPTATPTTPSPELRVQPPPPPPMHPVSNPASTVPPPPQRIPNWLQQAERLLRVVVRIYIGIIVAAVPWLPAFWDNNPLFTGSPSLQNFIANGAVRGLVTGLGLLNLWIALRDALRPVPAPNASQDNR